MRSYADLPPHARRMVQGLDSAAALVGNGQVHAAAAEERFTREKGTGAFPINAIRYCLQAARIDPGDVEAVAHSFAYEPYRDLFSWDDVLRRQFDEVYSLQAQLDTLEEQLRGWDWRNKFVQVPHHLAHAAGAFFGSGFEESLILISDGMGEAESATVGIGRGNGIEVIDRIGALHSLGILYGVVTVYLGFEMGGDEYKVMGLAPYGNQHRYAATFAGWARPESNGSYLVPLLAEDRSVEEKETHAGVLRALTEVLGPARRPDGEITQHHMDVAAALQGAVEALQLHLLRYWRDRTDLPNLALAGGVALNCAANGVIKRSRLFRRIFVQPAAGDDGTALGAALYVHAMRDPSITPMRAGLPLWGPAFDENAVHLALEMRGGLSYARFADFEELTRVVAERLASGQIVAWMQGRMEFGPRALGARSILADARDPDMRERVNRLVKKREDFRPFAPAVTEEAAAQFFEIRSGEEEEYAHMLLTARTRPDQRGRIPAVTHVDGSARVQVVSRTAHPRFWGLLRAFEGLTGIPVLLNTSFNVRGQPIVCSPDEAIDTFILAGLDALVMGNVLVERTNPGFTPTRAVALT